MIDFAKHPKKKKRIDLNPSAAERWTTCTASPKFIFDNWDRLPPESRTYADPGTSAHEVASAFLLDRKPRISECPEPITPEMRWHGWNYMEYVTGLMEPGAKLLVEQKLPLFYMPDRNAIVDVAILSRNALHIVDYKYGEGIIVSPENNLQMSIYARSVATGDLIPKDDAFPVFLHIYQPRTRGDEPFHVWETNWGTIRDTAQDVTDKARLIQDYAKYTSKQLDFAPSNKACQWCPAKGFCEARQRHLVKDLQPLATVNGNGLPAPGVLTEKQLAAIVEHGAAIKKWIDDGQEYALTQMKAGGKIPGFKLVTSRGGNRFWTDEKKAANFLLEDTILKPEEVFTKKVIGPAAAEKLIGKNQFPKRVFNLISKPPGQPVIAPLDDPRENALIDGASEFENLDADPLTDF